MGSNDSISSPPPPDFGESRLITAGQLRTLTGSIVGLYVIMHLANHSLGLISISAQEVARPWIMAFWHSWLGQLALYGSLSTHAALGLRSLAMRRHFRIPLWEATQLVAGLLIPYLLLLHIMNTRGTRIAVGIDINYEYEIAHLWINPWNRFRQVLLVLLVWGHFAAGIHYGLRFRAAYRRHFPLILALYLFVPAFGLLGYAEAGKAVAAKPPEWWTHVMSLGISKDPAVVRNVSLLKQNAGLAWLGLVALVFAGTELRNLRERRRRFKVTYPDGRSVKAPVGMTVLEVSRMARRPHVSVCGGRARCTTCRIRVHECAGDLPEPEETEARSLERLQAPGWLRLACQLRPVSDLKIEPLVDSATTLAAQHPGEHRNFGEEMCVTVLFVDLRGSTKLAENRLPYDVVFVMSRFFAEMSEAVEKAGGHYSNFTGDGLMALFGLKGTTRDGARSALACAHSMHERLDRFNHSMAGELEEPLAIGVGIHTGDAIVGQMGPPKTPVLTALGDTVNTTARLESLTKEFASPVVASIETLATAGVEVDVPIKAVQLRGRSSELDVALLDLDSLALCLFE